MGGNWKSLELIRLWAVWLQSMHGLASYSPSVVQKPAAPAALHTQAALWSQTQDAESQQLGAHAAGDPECLHVTQTTTMTHFTLFGVGARMQKVQLEEGSWTY